MGVVQRSDEGGERHERGDTNETKHARLQKYGREKEKPLDGRADQRGAGGETLQDKLKEAEETNANALLKKK